MVITNGKIILEDKIIEGKNLFIEDGKIVDISDAPAAGEDIIDAKGQYVSPGFIDLHTHGAADCPFSNSNPESVATAANYHAKFGTTSILPTVGSTTVDIMMKSLENIKECKNKKLAKNNIIGAHLEGPYFDPEMCGAQDLSCITAPIKEDYEKIIDAYGDIIAYWSYAPERDKNGEFCKYITSKGIIASAGHTAAKYDDMLVAMENGCTGVTHLYSCTSTITREQGFRKLGVIETAFLYDDLYVEIIADGKHLPPELIKLIFKIKGSDRICLVTDSLIVTGSKLTTGISDATPFIIEDGVCKVLDRSCFAGSIATADRLVRVCTKEAGISLVEAVKMLTKNPADRLKLNKGRIKVGYDADIVIFDDDIQISKVIVNGKTI